ncbi:MAG: acyl-CoA dehydrogenase [Sphingobacteriales bacterium]|nr:MAG: acyl-CoA dehydrogenase [Sphingobacteriales bacterium]
MKHPSAYLKPEWIKIIRDHASKAEAMGMLHPEQLALIHEQGWFKFLVPEIYSGLQLALPEQVRLEESLSWANGSLGWVVTLCSGAGWFGGFLQPELAAGVFKHPQLCLAGSGAATGTATISGNGYIVNGIWKYASGVHHATHITANCVIMQGNEAVTNDDGTPLILPFVFDKKNVTVLPGWKYMGMMATGSDAYEVKNLFVNGDRCFKIDPAAAIVDAPLYKYFFLQLAEATLAANISGLAIHFIDLCGPVFRERWEQGKVTEAQKGIMSNTLNIAIERVENARREFYNAVDASWDAIIMHGSITRSLFEKVSHTSRQLTKTAREGVNALYPDCGLMAANPGTELNQVWRDIHTAGQHSLLTFDA